MVIAVVPECNGGSGTYFYSLMIVEAASQFGLHDEVMLFPAYADARVQAACGPHVRSHWLDGQAVRFIKAALKPLPEGAFSYYRALRHHARPDRTAHMTPGTHRQSSWRRDRFQSFGAGLVVYAYPTVKALETRLPFVMPVHDLMHRLQPEFPEVSAGGEWERREYLYRNAAQRASVLLADSEAGKEDILNCYGSYVQPDRVEVLPYPPCKQSFVGQLDVEVARVRTHYKLPERYFFYPAQFWPHKNHERIVRALGLLKTTTRDRINIVLCGSHSGPLRESTFRTVMTAARTLGVEGQVIYLGYAPEEDMAGLYAGSEGLVMPTFCGPTNIPILEAWDLGCPVITSDLRGARQQAGPAALLVDPCSVEAIADGLRRLWTDESLRKSLILSGRTRVKQFTREAFISRFQALMERTRDRITAKEN